MVGDGSCLPVTAVGSALGSFSLSNVLVAPQMIHNLLSIRQFTANNSCSNEFDSSGLTVKDLASRRPLLRCNSSGPLYTPQLPSSPSSPCALVATPSPTTWHRRLGHPGKAALQSLTQSSTIICSKPDDDSCWHRIGQHTSARTCRITTITTG